MNSSHMFSFSRSYTPVNAITFLKLLCIFTLAALETFDFVWKIGNFFSIIVIRDYT